MKTVSELNTIIKSFHNADAHIHTHLCDGNADMTVKNIAQKALEKGLDGVILTPHFHKHVTRGGESLFEDTDVSILAKLRKEIDEYEAQDGRVRMLLSAEADILSESGEISLIPCKEAEDALDLVTPTLNYNPVLPLSAIHLTYGRDIDAIHQSGEYAAMAKSAGGIPRVLEAMYNAEENAVLNCPYPCMLGHFFAAHSMATAQNNWFGITDEQLALVRDGAKRITDACKKTGAAVDITGIHLLPGQTALQKASSDGFLHGFQLEFIKNCRNAGVPLLAGSDAHSLGMVGACLCYGEIFPNDYLA